MAQSLHRPIVYGAMRDLQRQSLQRRFIDGKAMILR